MALGLPPNGSDPGIGQGTITPDQRAYTLAAEVADLLLAHGLPLLGFDTYDQGRQVGFLLAPSANERMHVKRPVDGLDAAEVEAYVRRLL